MVRRETRSRLLSRSDKELGRALEAVKFVAVHLKNDDDFAEVSVFDVRAQFRLTDHVHRNDRRISSNKLGTLRSLLSLHE